MDLTAEIPTTARPRAWSWWSADRFAMLFYGVAAAGAVIGQLWVAMTHIPWPAGLAFGWRLAAVLPFAACLELLAMVLAALADQRMRIGERALGFRAFSAAVAALAVSVIVAGHWGDPYTVAAFGGLSVSAYTLWLLHSAARRRDALRAAGKLAAVAPAYGLWRRVRHPVLTARAAELAREHGLGLYASLREAELELRAEQRRPAIAAAVEAAIRSAQADPRMAEIAVTTLDLDRIAAELAERADYAGWAGRLAPAVSAPASSAPALPGTPGGADRNSGTGGGTAARGSGRNAGRNTRSGSLPPQRRGSAAGRGTTNAAERIRTLVSEHPELTRSELAERAGTSDRYVRKVLGSAPAAPPAPEQVNGNRPELTRD